jgi:hypothetical protein
VSSRRRLVENPFFVLGVGPESSRPEAERTAQRLIAELALGRESARFYETPIGRVERTADLVRAAIAELRDPERRLAHEVWAALPVHGGAPADAEHAIPWSICARAFGLRLG